MLPGPLPSAVLRGEHTSSRELRLYVCAMGVALSGTGRAGDIYFAFAPGLARACARATYRT